MTTNETSIPANTCVLKGVRAAYPSLVTPSPDLNGNDKYSVVLLIPKDQPIEHIKAALRAAIEVGKQKKWNGTVPADLHIPLQDGDVYAAKAPEKRSHYVGNYYINAKQDPEWGKPAVYDIYGIETASPQSIGSGDYVDSVVEFFPYKGQAGSGLSATPKVVKKVKQGEPIGGGISKEAALAALGIDPNASAPAAAEPAAPEAPASAGSGDPLDGLL